MFKRTKFSIKYNDKTKTQLEFYERQLHKKGYDTINCSEYLKKHLNNTLS